jgi:2-keto-3-deoxy-6-phosphogluconate aldolase
MASATCLKAAVLSGLSCLKHLPDPPACSRDVLQNCKTVPADLIVWYTGRVQKNLASNILTGQERNDLLHTGKEIELNANFFQAGSL